jgi:TonB family protein
MKPKHVLALSVLIAGLSTPSLRAAQEPAKPNAAAESSQPTCRYCPNPEYPAEARKAGISAKVLLEVTISEKGEVDPQNIRVIDDPGHGFAQEAVAVVKKWKFNPATLKDGKPTKTRTKVDVQFSTGSPIEKH